MRFMRRDLEPVIAWSPSPFRESGWGPHPQSSSRQGLQGTPVGVRSAPQAAAQISFWHDFAHLRHGLQTGATSTLYIVARLTPSALAIVLADSPLTCIRCARAPFFSSGALGRPMCWPRARRASRGAVRRCLPSSSSISARLARTRATIRPVAFDVSIPSLSGRRRCCAYQAHGWLSSPLRRCGLSGECRSQR
jgi:hypothetical protein